MAPPLSLFLVRAAPGSEDLALCVDPGAPQLGAEAGEPLFGPEGKPAPQLERALAFTGAAEEAV